jgi:hypothetical protein
MLSLPETPRSIALLLCLAILPNQMAFAAPKSLTPDEARQRIQKVHVDREVCIREANGVELVGRILSIDPDSFTMQTGNHPETTTIAYQDVVYVRGQASTRTVLIIVGATVGVAVLGGLLLHHEYEDSIKNEPTLPTLPSFPAVR